MQIIGGKARLVAEKYCDGLGAHLGSRLTTVKTKVKTKRLRTEIHNTFLIFYYSSF